MIYDVNYFIKKFEAIPDGNWLSGWLGDNGIHCVLGHCGARKGKDGFTWDYINTTESTFLIKIICDFFNVTEFDKMAAFVAMINDGGNTKYLQEHPKQRILAALYDIKKIRDGDTILGKEKVITKYVAVDAAIKEMELVEN